MALDEKIYELRREKLKQIEALGQQVYPRKYEFTHTIPQILAEYTAKTAEELENPRVNVRVAGRIMAIRQMGKAGFAHLQQDGERLQIYVKKDAVGEKGFELYKLLDIGDNIGVERISVPHAHRRTQHPRRRNSSFSPKTCCRCRRSGTAWRTWNCATASAMSIW